MKNRRYVLFGPPACGKSTLLQHLPLVSHHCTAIDLEHLQGDSSLRIAFLKSLAQLEFKGPLFIGCADIDPKDLPPGYEVILLWHNDWGEYQERVKRRNSITPEKAGQKEEEMYGHITRFRERRRFIFELDPCEFEGNPDGMARRIIAEINGS